jgi:nifR3 family TIM-barrel protein
MKIDQKTGDAATPGRASAPAERPPRWPSAFAHDAARPLVALAPMSGITDAGLRRIAMRFGADYVVSEMVASDAYVEGDEETRLRAEGAGLTPHIVQLAGCEARWIGEAARLADASGADAIDINMGCPAKRVTGGWAGSALMRDLDHAVGLVEAAVAATSRPVTVKMRLGWDDASRNAPELARRAVEAGARVITVHGRTRQQFYKGVADWRAVAAVRAAIPDAPLVVNGDIATLADAEAALAQSGADAVMVGRAALGRPWLPGLLARELAAGRALPPPPLLERRDALCEHVESLLLTMGALPGLRHARKHIAAALDDAAASDAPEALALKPAILTTESATDLFALVARAFTPVSMSSAARLEDAA